MAFAGAQSYQADYQYLDNDPAKWLRFTTFGALNLPNPTVVFREPGAPAPTISFYAKAIAIPEPTAAALAGLAALGRRYFISTRSLCTTPGEQALYLGLRISAY